jgi:hypothetical protein
MLITSSESKSEEGRGLVAWHFALRLEGISEARDASNRMLRHSGNQIEAALHPLKVYPKKEEVL